MLASRAAKHGRFITTAVPVFAEIAPLHGQVEPNAFQARLHTARAEAAAHLHWVQLCDFEKDQRTVHAGPSASEPTLSQRRFVLHHDGDALLQQCEVDKDLANHLGMTRVLYKVRHVREVSNDRLGCEDGRRDCRLASFAGSSPAGGQCTNSRRPRRCRSSPCGHLSLRVGLPAGTRQGRQRGLFGSQRRDTGCSARVSRADARLPHRPF